MLLAEPSHLIARPGASPGLETEGKRGIVAAVFAGGVRHSILLGIALCALLASPALACNGAQNILLTGSVNIDAGQMAEFRSMPPLKVVAVSAPPMARYDEKRKVYTGIGMDIFCFIAEELGIRFEVATTQDKTVADKLQLIREGLADVFIPLSHSVEREKHGIFTSPYYESHYAIIARHGLRAPIHGLADLEKYRVGYVKGVVFEPILQDIVPASQLRAYDQTSSDGLFLAVRNGEIDVAVFNKSIFIEKRYRQEFFDLEVIQTLREHPRAYRFYFSRTPEHQRLAAAFDQYLAAIDISKSVTMHEDGEREFLERYMAQRQQRVLLQYASVGAALLALAFYLAFLRYRRLTSLLAERNGYIQQQQQALQDAYRKLEALSRTDSLTGLSNRRHFDQMLAYEYAHYQRTGSPLSLFVIDVDHFKEVNDYYGHATGDEYLHTVARILESNVTRLTDLAARYGGEEFTCLLPDTTPEAALKVAERIRRAIAAQGLPNALATPPLLTLCIGIATVIEGDPGAQTLLDQADAQLYKAKQAGRDRVCATVIGR